MDSAVIVTRSINEELYQLSGEFLAPLGFQRIKLQDTTADGYFYILSQIEVDWVINIDEDAFVAYPERILGLMSYMKEHGYVCCGIPDGGVIDHRFHNPVVPNAFFTIHHLKPIREAFNLQEVISTRFTEDLKVHTPHDLIRGTAYAYDEFEPYYFYFFWLLKKGFRMLYLDGVNWIRDPISTILCDHLKQPILLHCWYARDFENQRQRYQQAIDFCREVRTTNLQPR